MTAEFERASSNASSPEKAKKFSDRAAADLKAKLDGVLVELESSQKEVRQQVADLYRLKTQVSDAQEALVAASSESKSLGEEVKDLYEQVSAGARAQADAEKAKKRLEGEKEEIQRALEAAEVQLELTEAKVNSAHAETLAARQETERRLAEKEDEFQSTRANHARALESMQVSLAAENKQRAEVVRQKKKLESDVNELEISVTHAKRNYADLQAVNKKLSQQLAEQQSATEAELRVVSELKEALAVSDRHSHSLVADIDELHSQLDHADRVRKALENDLNDAAERVNEFSLANANLAGQKRKADSDLDSVRGEVDELNAELKNVEERVRKAEADASRLANELACEQEHANAQARSAKFFENQVAQLQSRLDLAESGSVKDSKRIISSLEAKIGELEERLSSEARTNLENLKALSHHDRSTKDLLFQSEEDKKNQVRLQRANEKLEAKLKTYRRQIEETEEVAALNLSKYRQAQQEMESALERADIAENQVAKLRAARSASQMGRGASVARESCGASQFPRGDSVRR